MGRRRTTAIKRGYRNVIDEAVRLNSAGIDCPLAIETSGHAALRENYFLDDGMYLVTRAHLSKPCSRKQRRADRSASLIDEPAASRWRAAEIRLPVTWRRTSAAAGQAGH